MKTYTTMVWVLNAMELLSCLVAFAYFKKLRTTKWRLLPFYLFTIVLLEMLGRYLGSVPELMRYNPVLFNYVAFPLQFLFFYWIFYTDDSLANSKKYILIGTLLYLAAVVVDIVYFSNKRYFFHSFSYSVGNILLLVWLVKYFYALATSEDILKFSNNLMFWISLGVFVYYIGTLPFWSLRNVLAFEYPGLFLKYAYTGLVLDYLMYLFFIIGIIRCKLK